MFKVDAAGLLYTIAVIAPIAQPAFCWAIEVAVPPQDLNRLISTKALCMVQWVLSSSNL